MPYNFNPNFNKHLNTKKDNYKFIKRTGDETPYSNPDVRSMNNNYNNYKSPKLINFLNFISNGNLCRKSSLRCKRRYFI